MKLHLSSDEFDLTDPRLEPAFAPADERRLPVVVHAGPEVGSPGAAVLDGASGGPDCAWCWPTAASPTWVGCTAR